MDADALKHQQRQERGGEVEDDRDDEDGYPAPGRGLEHTPDRDEQRGGALGGVEQTVVRRGELAAEQVAADRREEAVDLAPGEEGQPGEEHEEERDVGR